MRFVESPNKFPTNFFVFEISLRSSLVSSIQSDRYADGDSAFLFTLSIKTSEIRM